MARVQYIIPVVMRFLFVTTINCCNGGSAQTVLCKLRRRNCPRFLKFAVVETDLRVGEGVMHLDPLSFSFFLLTISMPKTGSN